MKNSCLGNCFLLLENSGAFQPHPAGCFGHEAVQEHPLKLPRYHWVQMQESSSPLHVCFIQCAICSWPCSGLDSTGAASGRIWFLFPFIFWLWAALVSFSRWPQLSAEIEGLYCKSPVVEACRTLQNFRAFVTKCILLENNFPLKFSRPYRFLPHYTSVEAGHLPWKQDWKQLH